VPNSFLGDAIHALAREMIESARSALADPDRADPVAVHDFRKAIKRWRALLRLLEPVMGEQARMLRHQARDMARQLAAARNVQSALDALADLRKSGIPKATLTVIGNRLTALRRAKESATLTAAKRAELTAALNATAAAIAAWQLPELTLADLANLLSRGYRRARRAVPNSWSGADGEELHKLRQLVVVHRHQLELLEHIWPRFAKGQIEEAQRLRDRLGKFQDLAVLAHLTESRQPLARWHGELIAAIQARQAKHLALAARTSKRLFAEKPKPFRRRLEVAKADHVAKHA
jgi:CHAD domain-containing protein